MYLAFVDQAFISDLSNYAVYAEARLGDNGNEFGMPELALVDSVSGGTAGRFTWAQTSYDGSFDSGWINVQMTAAPGTNGLSFQVNDGQSSSALQHDAAQYGTIAKVDVTAAAAVSGVSFQWSQLQLTFYRDGSVTETVSIPSAQTPRADTSGGGSGPVEQICTITPTASNNDEVIVTGQIRLTADAWVFPSATELFGQVAIYANA